MLCKMVTKITIALCILGLSFAPSKQTIAAEPEGTVMIIIPAGPGGANDRLARGIQQALDVEKIIPNDIAVKNMPGGGGAVAWANLNRNLGDMSQISTFMSNLLTNELMGVSPITYEDMTPIATIAFDNACYAINPKDPIINSREALIETLKNKPEEVKVGFAPGAGNHWHISFAGLAEALNVDSSKVRYTVFGSGGKARTALLGGHINLQVVSWGVASKFHESGDLQCVGIPSEQRLEGIGADIPTWKELGVDYVDKPWRGILAPGGLTPEQIAFWEEKIKEMVASDQWKKFSAQEGYETKFLGHDETMKLLGSERNRYQRVLKTLGIIE